jgi:hypothetical protein
MGVYVREISALLYVISNYLISLLSFIITVSSTFVYREKRCDRLGMVSTSTSSLAHDVGILADNLPAGCVLIVMCSIEFSHNGFTLGLHTRHGRDPFSNNSILVMRVLVM